MQDHPDAWPFKDPVDAREVPDYYDIIRDPMGNNYHNVLSYLEPILFILCILVCWKFVEFYISFSSAILFTCAECCITPTVNAVVQ